jgi:HAD superfamily hydrolase (TIGR01509 family)
MPREDPAIAPAAVLFDCDGLLLDTAVRWEAAERRVVSARGGVWRTSDRSSVHGRSLQGAAAVLAAHVGEPESASTLLDEMVDAFLEEVVTFGVEPMPGARELLERLVPRTPVAVASNMSQGLLHEVLDRAGLDVAWTARVGARPDLAAKPAPDIYLAACAAVGFEPARCHALEDSQTGVDAARAAGVPVTGVSASTQLVKCRQVASLHDLYREPIHC